MVFAMKMDKHVRCLGILSMHSIAKAGGYELPNRTIRYTNEHNVSTLGIAKLQIEGCNNGETRRRNGEGGISGLRNKISERLKVDEGFENTTKTFPVCVTGKKTKCRRGVRT